MNKISLSYSIPPGGEDPEQILQRISTLQKDDVDWKNGRVWSLVYSAGEEHDKLLKAAGNLQFSTNYLNPLAFKSLKQMEQEIVSMTVGMLHGPDTGVGTLTSGGTESILLAMFCYRQRARALNPRIREPEVVAPLTIHPAFDKAALLFGLRIRKAEVDNNRRVIPGAMEKLINDNTIALVASAPSYPNGVLDPVEEIAAMATKHHLPCHVDACIGGFMLPWVEKLGHALPPWDYRVEGVSSISADVHKFGFGAKGVSVLTYRSMDFMRHQFMVSTEFPGGIYISPTLLGTRPGGPIAAAWAGMHHLGENGYLSIAKNLLDATQKLKLGLLSIPEIRIVGDPCMNILSYTTLHNKPDLFVIADQMEDRGWMMDRQQFPDCIHLTVLPTNMHVVDQYIQDLEESVAYAREHREASAKGNAAIYGLMARIPFRGMVEKSVKKIMEDMYGIKDEEIKANTGSENKNTIAQNPRWMGGVNRFLSAWKRWKRFFRFKKRSDSK